MGEREGAAVRDGGAERWMGEREGAAVRDGGAPPPALGFSLCLCAKTLSAQTRPAAARNKRTNRVKTIFFIVSSFGVQDTNNIAYCLW